MVANLPNEEFNYPSSKHQEKFHNDLEEDIHEWQMPSAYVGSNGKFWVHPWKSIDSFEML